LALVVPQLLQALVVPQLLQALVVPQLLQALVVPQLLQALVVPQLLQALVAVLRHLPGRIGPLHVQGCCKSWKCVQHTRFLGASALTLRYKPSVDAACVAGSTVLGGPRHGGCRTSKPQPLSILVRSAHLP